MLKVIIISLLLMSLTNASPESYVDSLKYGLIEVKTHRVTVCKIAGRNTGVFMAVVGTALSVYSHILPIAKTIIKRR